MEVSGVENQPAPLRELARDGSAFVFEYRCAACIGEAPEPEQFHRASIAIVRSGSFGFRSDEPVQLLTKGFLLLGNPGQQYEVSHEHAAGDICLVFQFKEEALHELEIRTRTARPRIFSRSVLPPIPRVEALRRAAEERLSAPNRALALEEVGVALLGTVLASANASETPTNLKAGDTRQTRDRVRAAIEILEHSIADAEDLHLNNIAKIIGLSQFHFLRSFKQATGVTPHRFLIQARIRKAIDLLRDTTRSVTDISYDVGFGDLSNFINTFRREVGCSPARFRKHGISLR